MHGSPILRWPSVRPPGKILRFVVREMRRFHGVDGHQDLPSDGHEVQATAITESDRIR